MFSPQYNIDRDQPTSRASPLRINVMLSNLLYWRTARIYVAARRRSSRVLPLSSILTALKSDLVSKSRKTNKGPAVLANDEWVSNFSKVRKEVFMYSVYGGLPGSINVICAVLFLAGCFASWVVDKYLDGDFG